MNISLTPFAFGEHLVRTVDRGGAPWFVAADVCNVLGIQNPSQALAALDDDEKGLCLTDTLGGEQEMLAVTESGLYHLVFKSRKPAAKAFRRWVTGEVLPAIRRTGSYSPAHQAYLGLLKEQIALGISPDLAARNAVRLSPAHGAATGAPALRNSPSSDLNSLLALMEEQRVYSIDELLDLLPQDHPALRSRSLKGRQIALGRYLEDARQQDRITRRMTRGKYEYTKAPVVVPFSGAES